MAVSKEAAETGDADGFCWSSSRVGPCALANNLVRGNSLHAIDRDFSVAAVVIDRHDVFRCHDRAVDRQGPIPASLGLYAAARRHEPWHQSYLCGDIWHDRGCCRTIGDALRFRYRERLHGDTLREILEQS